VTLRLASVFGYGTFAGGAAGGAAIDELVRSALHGERGQILPGARVRNTAAGARGGRCGSNTRRSLDTYVSSDAIAAAGGSPDHSSSINVSTATGRSTRLNNNPNSARPSVSPLSVLRAAQ